MYIVGMKARFDELKAAVVLAKHEVDKTAFPSRIYQRRYKNGELKIRPD
jgi:hypothetical protein